MDSNSIPKFKDRKSLGVKNFSRTTHKIFHYLQHHCLCMMIVKLTYAVSLLKQFKGAIFFCFFQRKLKILNLLLSQSAFQQWKKEVSLFNILVDVL